MNYQWYPGHMTKARRMMEENIKLIDLVIEVVDATILGMGRGAGNLNMELLLLL